jgi:osmotically-inducible protein OsmY
MKTGPYLLPLAAVVAVTLAGCSTTSAKAPDVSDSIRASLDQAGLNNVTEKQDREKGVVTLGGSVPADGDKVRAGSIAKFIAGRQVVSNQIAVIPAGAEREAKAVNSDLDLGVEKNLDAALREARLHESVKYEVANAVVTLTGNVDSQWTRTRAQNIASAIPHVKQVVNELQITRKRATSSN